MVIGKSFGVACYWMFQGHLNFWGFNLAATCQLCKRQTGAVHSRWNHFGSIYDNACLVWLTKQGPTVKWMIFQFGVLACLAASACSISWCKIQERNVSMYAIPLWGQHPQFSNPSAGVTVLRIWYLQHFRPQPWVMISTAFATKRKSSCLVHLWTASPMC